MIPEFNKGKEIYYEHIERYLFASQFVKNKRVIDLGCGPGYGSIIMSEHGATFVQGVDNSLETIRYAKELYGNKKTNFRVSDVQKLSILQEVGLGYIKLGPDVSYRVNEPGNKGNIFFGLNIYELLIEFGPFACHNTPGFHIFP